MRPASIGDYRARARRALPRMVFDFIDGGSFAENTLRRNVEDFASLSLRQRVLRGGAAPDLSLELFGQRLSLPLLLAPVGMAGLLARRGEVQAARAARKSGIPFCLSTVSVCSIDEVAQSAGTAPWFQLYMLRDRGWMKAMLDRAAAAGAPALVFTVDLAVPGIRYRDFRSGFAAEPSLERSLRRIVAGATHPGWLWDVFVRGRPLGFGNLSGAQNDQRSFAAFWSWIRANFEPSASWADIEWLRAHWRGPIVLKGILDSGDALQAVKCGADAVIVSNHGGRQLDDVVSSIRALPGIVAAVNGRLPVLFDGGIRSGLDMLKALALGANACLVGRPWAYALAAGGEAGVAHMVDILRQELTTALTLSGCSDLASVAGCLDL
ncbi:MAG: L-lactate dehydrogenase [Proteobacteria bacterium]|nr:L-lactate dehydrogenase [Pseudomonadota bacterium]